MINRNGDKMKNINRYVVILFVFSLLLTSLISCKQEEDVYTDPIDNSTYEYCAHIDNDDNTTCDLCGEYHYDAPNHTVHGVWYETDRICKDCATFKSTEGLEFVLKDDGTYMLVGIGSCTETAITVGSYNNISVTAIADEAFMNNTTLQSVTISCCVLTLGERAFYGCTSIDTVCFSWGVKEIGKECFRGCTALGSIWIDQNVEKIGDYAFADCEILSIVELPRALKDLGSGAFYGCTALKNVCIPIPTATVGSNVFGECPNAKIFCRRKGRPDGWQSDWNSYGCPVEWGYIYPVTN